MFAVLDAVPIVSPVKEVVISMFDVLKLDEKLFDTEDIFKLPVVSIE